METFDVDKLERLFRETFYPDYHTLLQGGRKEPLYLPATEKSPAIIGYTRDYFRSALHEVAHWCVAGIDRRQQEDYGYWYVADGRDSQVQQAFEQVEARPQAIELLFCAACGHAFRVSLDNFSDQPVSALSFEKAVISQVNDLLSARLPFRCQRWIDVLSKNFPDGRWPARKAVAAVFRRW